MPLYEFTCERCGERFEELVPAGASPPCPACGGPDVRRIFSAVAPPAKLGITGAAKRRSEAERRARREQRKERRASE